MIEHIQVNRQQITIGRARTFTELRLCAVVVLLLSTWCVQAQSTSITVRGKILTDSIKIGKPFPYSLAVSYPTENRILFPDSTFQFTPFEYSDKQYFPTVTTNGISYDSAVYYLESYEIDSMQSLALPVFVLSEKDCTAVFAEPDQVWLQHLVTLSIDSVEAAQLPLKVNTAYEPVNMLFNYYIAGAVAGAIVVLLLTGWLLFGKRIRQNLKMRRMRKAFHAFIENFNTQVESMKLNYSPQAAEKSLVLWKQYLENLEGRPLTKYSSKEIIHATGSESLKQPLQSVDRLIYAREQPQSFDAFYALKSYSEDRFYQKLQDLKQPAT